MDTVDILTGAVHKTNKANFNSSVALYLFYNIFIKQSAMLIKPSISK